MNKTINIILQFLKSDLGKHLMNLCSTLNNLISYLRELNKNKEKQTKDQEIKTKENKIDDVTKKGKIEDLLDL